MGRRGRECVGCMAVWVGGEQGGTSTENVASSSRQATSTPLDVGPQVIVDGSMRFAFTTSGALGPLPMPRIRHWIWPTPRSMKPVPWIEIWDGRGGFGWSFGFVNAAFWTPEKRRATEHVSRGHGRACLHGIPAITHHAAGVQALRAQNGDQVVRLI